MNTIIYFFIYFILINLIGFFTMWYDKNQAFKHSHRVSENALFMLALLLGGIGIYTGMFKFRHKTQKTKFTIGIPIMILINSVLIYLLFTKVFPFLGL